MSEEGMLVVLVILVISNNPLFLQDMTQPQVAERTARAVTRTSSQKGSKSCLRRDSLEIWQQRKRGQWDQQVKFGH